MAHFWVFSVLRSPGKPSLAGARLRGGPDPGRPNAPSSHLHDPLGPRESVTSEPAAPGKQQAPVTVRVRLLTPSTTRLAHKELRGALGGADFGPKKVFLKIVNGERVQAK